MLEVIYISIKIAEKCGRSSISEYPANWDGANASADANATENVHGVQRCYGTNEGNRSKSSASIFDFDEYIYWR